MLSVECFGALAAAVFIKTFYWFGRVELFSVGVWPKPRFGRHKEQGHDGAGVLSGVTDG
jgi:hypothetical protein